MTDLDQLARAARRRLRPRSCSTTWTPRRWPRRCGSPPAGHARGVRRAHPRARPRGGRDRRRLHLGRRADPLGEGLRPRPGPAARPDALLAADIGNSHTVLGLLDDGEVLGRLAGRDRRAPDGRRVGRAAPRPARRATRTTIDGIAVCSTVPAVLQEWRDMLARPLRRRCRSVVVEPGVRTGVPVLTDNPREVGTDRIVNALAAADAVRRPGHRRRLRRHRDDVRRGEWRRASTSAAPSRPGIEISLEALERRGAQLRMVELRATALGDRQNTVEALQSGMVFGVASQVDGIVARMIEELGGAVGASPSSPPATSRRSWSTSAAASPRTTLGSPCEGSSWCTRETAEVPALNALISEDANRIPVRAGWSTFRDFDTFYWTDADMARLSRVRPLRKGPT